MWAEKLCTNKILQFLTAGGGLQANTHLTCVMAVKRWLWVLVSAMQSKSQVNPPVLCDNLQVDSKVSDGLPEFADAIAPERPALPVKVACVHVLQNDLGDRELHAGHDNHALSS